DAGHEDGVGGDLFIQAPEAGQIGVSVFRRRARERGRGQRAEDQQGGAEPQEAFAAAATGGAEGAGHGFTANIGSRVPIWAPLARKAARIRMYLEPSRARQPWTEMTSPAAMLSLVHPRRTRMEGELVSTF